MKAISIRQPWAYLIAAGYKQVENRSWPTRYRGEVLIHAGKGMTRHEYEDAEDLVLMLNRRGHGIILPPFSELQRGGIVGMAEITDCVVDSESPWFFGKYGFVMQNARPLPFIEFKGALGLFNGPDINAAKEAT